MFSQNEKPVVPATGSAEQAGQFDVSNFTVPASGTQQLTSKKYNSDDDPCCLTWSRRGVARAIGATARHVISLEQRDLIPKPRRIGRSVAFLRADILAWLEMGCPSRERFEAMRRRGGAQ